MAVVVIATLLGCAPPPSPPDTTVPASTTESVDPEISRADGWRPAISRGDADSATEAIEAALVARDWSVADATLSRVRGELDALTIAPVLDAEPRLVLVERGLTLLAEARDPDALGPLISALETGGLPTAAVRWIVSTLGTLGDPLAVDVLITTPFRVRDAPGTQSVTERSVRAVAAIGEPAVPRLLRILDDDTHRVFELARDQGLDAWIVEASIVRALGAIGSTAATQPLLDRFVVADCDGRRASGEEGIDGRGRDVTRTMIAEALGTIGDPAAAETLCACSLLDEPSQVQAIVDALGRVGGPKALACLETVVARGAYHPDFAAPGFEHEIRWDAVRYALLAADGPRVRALVDGLAPDVREAVDERGFAEGLPVFEACAGERACLLDILADEQRHPFAREAAAFQLARANGGDLAIAEAIADAFTVPDARVRTSLAWLVATVADGRGCPTCVASLESVLADEAGRAGPEMTRAWVFARLAIARLR